MFDCKRIYEKTTENCKDFELVAQGACKAASLSTLSNIVVEIGRTASPLHLRQWKKTCTDQLDAITSHLITTLTQR